MPHSDQTVLPTRAHVRPSDSRSLARVACVAAALACGILAGCATSARLALTPRTPVPIGPDSLVQRVEQTHAVHVRLLHREFSRRTENLPAFEIRVRNRAERPISFTPAHVSADSAGKPVRIYTAAELVRRIEKEAEQEAHEKSGERAEKILQSGSTRGDPSSAIVRIEAAKALDQTVASRASLDKKLAEVARSIVPVSISPGGEGSGVIRLHAEDLSEGAPLRLTVTLGDEVYPFVFDVGRVVAAD